MSITILKHSDTYVFADYLNGRAARRCRELTDAAPVQIISRRKEDGAPLMALLKPSYWDAYLADFAAIDAAPWAYQIANKTDDFLGGNLTTLSWLLNATPEVKSATSRVAQDGTSNAAFEVYQILNTVPYSKQDFANSPGGAPQGGEIIAYLVSYDLYLGMQQSPVATVYTGTGNGTIAPQLCPGLSVAETITLTCTSAVADGGIFSVVGSVSGSLGTLTVGVPFVSFQFKCTISDGSIDFIVGDNFVVDSRAALL